MKICMRIIMFRLTEESYGWYDQSLRFSYNTP